MIRSQIHIQNMHLTVIDERLSYPRREAEAEREKTSARLYQVFQKYEEGVGGHRV